MYSVSQGYGFCESGEKGRVFFRVEDFTPLDPGGPLPIVGEEVDIVEVLEASPSPRATGVRRVKRPVLVQGRVRSFDAAKGWGFVEVGSQQYFLHRSDLREVFLPTVGTVIAFYPGMKKEKPRACHAHRPGKVST
jgi:cold shock CspA family protein